MNKFNELAHEWNEAQQRIERTTFIMDKIKSELHLHKRMRVLDYGCGTGLLSFQLYEHVGSLTLVDTSRGMLDVVDSEIQKNHIKSMETILIDSIDDILMNRFDMICSVMTLHHIQDIETFLNHIKNMLSDEGHLCIADLILEDGSFHDGSFNGHKGFDPAQLSNSILKIGFHACNSWIIYTIKKKVGNQIRAFPMFLLIAEK